MIKLLEQRETVVGGTSMRRSVCFAAATLVAAALAGCSSSGSPAKSSAAPVTSTPTPVGSTSAAPSTTAAPTPSAAPLSAFEKDPSVQAFRSWAALAGRVVNTGHYTSTALNALMTPYMQKTVKAILQPDVGSYYPGPLPLQPVGVTVASASHRIIRGCGETQGFTQNLKTHQPLHAAVVTPVSVDMLMTNGHWLVNSLYVNKQVACSGVKVNSQRW